MTRRTVRPVTLASLRREWPLPELDRDGDKETRGVVLAVGGAVEIVGALMLAGVGALRAGAGKLQLATCRSIAPTVAALVPEARVVRLAESRGGGISPRAAALVASLGKQAAAVLVGPGMVDPPATTAFVTALMAALVQSTGDEPAVVLDAGAIAVLADEPSLLHGFDGRASLTPHAGEAATALGVPIAEVIADPLGAAREAATRFGASVALKGAVTWIVQPDGKSWSYSGGDVGLATSGSGDVLAGVVAGLLARGAEPSQALAWGAYAHGTAGGRLAEKFGPVGYLARELLAEIPLALHTKGRGNRD